MCLESTGGSPQPDFEQEQEKGFSLPSLAHQKLLFLVSGP